MKPWAHLIVITEARDSELRALRKAVVSSPGDMEALLAYLNRLKQKRQPVDLTVMPKQDREFTKLLKTLQKERGSGLSLIFNDSFPFGRFNTKEGKIGTAFVARALYLMDDTRFFVFIRKWLRENGLDDWSTNNAAKHIFYTENSDEMWDYQYDSKVEVHEELWFPEPDDAINYNLFYGDLVDMGTHRRGGAIVRAHEERFFYIEYFRTDQAREARVAEYREDYPDMDADDAEDDQDYGENYGPGMYGF